MKNRYSTINNMFFVFWKTWQIDKSLLFSLFIKVPSLVALPLLNNYLTKCVVSLVAQQAYVITLISSISAILISIMLFQILDRYASAKLEWRSFGNRFSYIHMTSQKAMDADYANIESSTGQDMQEKALKSVYTPQSGIQQVFNQLVCIFSGIVGLILYSALIFKLSPWLVVYLLLLSLASYIVQRYNNNWVHRNKDNWVPLDRKLQYIINKSGDYTIGKDAKMFRMQSWFSELFVHFFEQRTMWYKKQEQRNLVFSVLNTILIILRDGVAYLFLLNQIVRTKMNVGDFVFYFGLISQYSNWLFEIMNAMGALHVTSLSLCDLRAFLDMPDHFNRGKGHALPDDTCDIRFNHVAFSYSENGEQVLKDIDFHIRKGEKIAIVGLNGAGKTTLIKLLCGLYRPISGSIEVDGISVGEYNRDDYYTLFSVVFQDIILLPISIAKNIALCEEKKIDRLLLEKVLKISGLYEKVQSLPKKEDTLLMKSIQEDSIEFSGGEQQKLALARALYKNGQIVVLDEPTAALDPIAENEMYLQYSELTAGRTTIFISHRLSSTRFCDRILFLDNGKIVEVGSHDELMKRNGKYAELFRIQSRYYEEGGEVCGTGD